MLQGKSRAPPYLSRGPTFPEHAPNFATTLTPVVSLPSFCIMDAVPSAFCFLPTVANASLSLLCFASLVLAIIDLRRGIIPNWLNLAIAVAGLGRAALVGGFAATLAAACEGLAVGAVLWLLRWLFFRWRKYRGLGLGDVKLLAASGIWIGIAGVPVQLLIASLSALLAAGLLLWRAHDDPAEFATIRPVPRAWSANGVCASASGLD
jgi:leader peptidase (prepilin peptidase) / N-methyltransferase